MKNNSKTGGKGRKRSGRNRRARRRLLLAVVAVLAVGLIAAYSLGWDGGPAGSPSAERLAGAAGSLSAERTFHDFGRISMRDGKVSVRYPVRNRSDAPALVEQLYTSCMCTEATLVIGEERWGPFGMRGHTAIPRINRVIEPGGEAVVVAQFDPNAHGPAGVGRNDRAVEVVMGGSRVLELRFTAFVTP